MKKYVFIVLSLLSLPMICGAQTVEMKRHEISASYGVSPTADYVSLYDGLSLDQIPGDPLRKGSIDKYGAVGLN